MTYQYQTGKDLATAIHRKDWVTVTYIATTIVAGAALAIAGAKVFALTNAGGGEPVSLHRPYIRQWVLEGVNEATEWSSDGRPIDPNTGEPINGTPDLGHKPGKEFWRMKAQAEAEGLSQKQFNERMNDPNLYQWEDPASNRSHRYERP